MSRNIENRQELIKANSLHDEVSSKNGKLILISHKSCIGIYLIQDTRLTGVFAMPKDTRSGEIILGRVSNIKKDISAAFIKISDDTECFMKLSNVPDEYLPLKQGMLIPVKIRSDEQKGKLISVTARIKKGKLPEGWEHKSAFTVLFKPENSLMSFISARVSPTEYDEIVTDSTEIYEMLAGTDNAVRLYKDDKIGLSELYALKTKLSESLSRKVYMKSGAFLVIDHTEAFTVIDVNSGKNTTSNKADARDVILKLNLEAAKETALQIKLRNISGMILIDFINMESKEDEDKLIGAMNEFVSDEKVKVNVIDITPLGIMEMTRQKTDKPLSEISDMLLE